MNFEEKKYDVKMWGVYVGYLLFYFVFTTVLFFILSLTEKLPEHWNYLSVANITFFGVILIKILKRKVF